MQLFLRCNKRPTVTLFNMCSASATKQARAWRPTDANTLKDRDDGGRRFFVQIADASCDGDTSNVYKVANRLGVYDPTNPQQEWRLPL